MIISIEVNRFTLCGYWLVRLQHLNHLLHKPFPFILSFLSREAYLIKSWAGFIASSLFRHWLIAFQRFCASKSLWVNYDMHLTKSSPLIDHDAMCFSTWPPNGTPRRIQEKTSTSIMSPYPLAPAIGLSALTFIGSVTGAPFSSTGPICRNFPCLDSSYPKSSSSLNCSSHYRILPFLSSAVGAAMT